MYNAKFKALPKNNDTYVDRSNINIALARWTDVLTNCDAYLAMHPENKSMHVKRGDALNHLGRDQEAIAELAPNLQKEDPRSMGLLGASYRNLHQYQKAIDMSTNWLNQIGPEPGLLTVKADSERDLKLYHAAADDYALLIKDFPQAGQDRMQDLKNCQTAAEKTKP